MVPAPSGRQTVLVHADQRAVVVEVGGGLRQYRAGDAEVLDGYAEDARCSAGRGEPLIPWPNRLDGGSYDFGDVHEQAPLNEPEKGNAIHGLTRWSSWEVLDAGTDHATMGLVLRPQPGWAWTLQLSITYRLRRDGLQVTLRAINRSDRPCPWGAGFHPYLLAPSGRVDDLELTVPAATRYLADERGLPTGTEPVAGSSVDFRAGRPIGDQQIDVAFKDLTRGSDGQAVIAVADPQRPAGRAASRPRLGPRHGLHRGHRRGSGPPGAGGRAHDGAGQHAALGRRPHRARARPAVGGLVVAGTAVAVGRRPTRSGPVRSVVSSAGAVASSFTVQSDVDRRGAACRE
jgi:aldose 1-epimerase